MFNVVCGLLQIRQSNKSYAVFLQFTPGKLLGGLVLYPYFNFHCISLAHFTTIMYYSLKCVHYTVVIFRSSQSSLDYYDVNNTKLKINRVNNKSTGNTFCLVWNILQSVQITYYIHLKCTKEQLTHKDNSSISVSI